MEFSRRGGSGRPNAPVDSTTWIGKLGLAIRKARAMRGMTLNELVSSSNSLSVTRMSMLERGDGDVSISGLVSICDVLGVSVGDVIPDDALPDVSMVSGGSVARFAEFCSVCDIVVSDEIIKLGDLDVQ
jgi:transcriptional regulator with XRE-family HTH domain